MLQEKSDIYLDQFFNKYSIKIYNLILIHLLKEFKNVYKISKPKIYHQIIFIMKIIKLVVKNKNNILPSQKKMLINVKIISKINIPKNNPIKNMTTQKTSSSQKSPTNNHNILLQVDKKQSDLQHSKMTKKTQHPNKILLLYLTSITLI
jgi:hypothetical protein